MREQQLTDFQYLQRYIGKTVVITQEGNPSVRRYNNVGVESLVMERLGGKDCLGLCTNRGFFEFDGTTIIQQGYLIGPHSDTLKTDQGLFLLGI